MLIIPKCHITSLAEIKVVDAHIMQQLMFATKRIAQQLDIDKDGYRVVTNIGTNGGQTIPHMHFHVLGGRVMHWPPG
jgi:histidine triad (HIT) family protein